MDKVTVSLQNCYGISSLSHCFDFSEQEAFAIYAPNGAMKSSFAQTFKDIADGAPSKDRIFPSRITHREITDENRNDLPKESVFVMPPYDEFFGHAEKASTLLVNNTLRNEYVKLHTDIDKEKADFLKVMKEQSGGSKKLLDKEISLAFMKSDDDESFYLALERIKNEVKDQKDSPFSKMYATTPFLMKKY